MGLLIHYVEVNSEIILNNYEKYNLYKSLSSGVAMFYQNILKVSIFLTFGLRGLLGHVVKLHLHLQHDNMVKVLLWPKINYLLSIFHAMQLRHVYKKNQFEISNVEGKTLFYQRPSFLHSKDEALNRIISEIKM